MYIITTALGRRYPFAAEPRLGASRYAMQILIIDRQTGAVVAKAKTMQTARMVRDRKDAAYGASRYSIRVL